MPIAPVKIAPPPQPSRMKLSAIRQSKVDSALRWLIIGVDKIGKSTFGSEAPGPIFMSAERGLDRLDVPMYPEPENFKEVLEIVDDLTFSDHQYKTLVIDSIDWIEPLIWKEVCQKANATDIEAVGGGFQKGYIAAVDVWRLLLARLERLRDTKNMEIGLIAHAMIANFDNPAGPSYKRFQAAIHQKAYDPIKQWVDVIGFAMAEDVYGPDAGVKKGKIKGVSTGKRLLHLERTAAFDAGNRLGLPPVIAFDYASFAAAAKGGHAGDPEELAAECRRLAEGHPEAGKILSYVAAHEGDAAALSKALNSLRVLSSE